MAELHDNKDSGGARPSSALVRSRAPARVRPVPAVSRAISILRLIGNSPEPLGVQAIARSLGLIASTSLHILRVLVSEELLRVDAVTKRYRLGAGTLSLARTALTRLSFPSAAQPILEQVAAQWNVTAFGAEVIGLQHSIVISLAKPAMPFRLDTEVGSRFPAFIGATGRLVASFSRLSNRELEKHFRKLTWGKLPLFHTWLREVAAVRERGFGIDRGNNIPGITIVAAPVLDKHGRLTHSLAAAGLLSVLDGAGSLALGRALKQQASALSLML